MCLKRMLLNFVLTPLFVQSMVNYYPCKRLKLRGPYTPFFTGHYSIFLRCKMAIKSISCVMNAMTYNKHIRGGNLAVKRRTKLQSTQFKRNLQVSAYFSRFFSASFNEVFLKIFATRAFVNNAFSILYSLQGQRGALRMRRWLR